MRRFFPKIDLLVDCFLQCQECVLHLFQIEILRAGDSLLREKIRSLLSKDVPAAKTWIEIIQFIQISDFQAHKLTCKLRKVNVQNKSKWSSTLKLNFTRWHSKTAQGMISFANTK